MEKKKYFEAVATQTGYFGKRRVREGSLLSVSEDEFSDVWMEKVDKIKPKKKEVVESASKKIEENVI